MTDPRFIAELRVKFLYADGSERDGRVAVGVPTEDEDEQASCLAAIDGLSTPVSTLRGGGSLQALRIALQYLAWELHAPERLNRRSCPARRRRARSLHSHL